MKTGIVLLAFVISCCAPCNAQRTPVEDAVASALKWYFRWIMPIPTDEQRIECTLALFERSSFAYCGRISRSMGIDTVDPDMPHVTSIVLNQGILTRHWRSFDGIATAMPGNWDPRISSLSQSRGLRTVK
jgi:hypothetical protein